MSFTEDWYADGQIEQLRRTAQRVRDLDGGVYEFGCWEGKSTCALAREVEPEMVFAVDNWTGSHAENEGHPTVAIAKKRDVLAAFKENVVNLTSGNVRACQSDHDEFISEMSAAGTKVKLAHIDGAHDYDSVRRIIERLKPLMTARGIICGDDFVAAGAHRHDLNGGVERAVRESCPAFEQHGNLWVWTAP